MSSAFHTDVGWAWMLAGLNRLGLMIFGGPRAGPGLDNWVCAGV